ARFRPAPLLLQGGDLIQSSLYSQPVALLASCRFVASLSDEGPLAQTGGDGNSAESQGGQDQRRSCRIATHPPPTAFPFGHRSCSNRLAPLKPVNVVRQRRRGRVAPAGVLLETFEAN